MLVETLQSYLLNDRDFYVDISSREIMPDYRETITPLLPPDWSLVRRQLWFVAGQTGMSIPNQGFKIHVSGTPSNACSLIKSVAPLCVEEQTAFKVVADPFLLG